MSELTSLAGILLALSLLIALAFRGLSILILAPALALVAAALSPDAPLLASLTQVYMPALGRFVTAFFLLFLLGAIFGRLMEDSGAASDLATGLVKLVGPQRSILAVVLACGVLTYGGVSLFVVAFAVAPLAMEIFRSANLPRRLIPGTIALGAFTFTMTALPGTPAIQNVIPMPYFGTTTFAAPGLGLVAGVTMLLVGLAWLGLRSRRAALRGEGFGSAPSATTHPPIRFESDRPQMGSALLPILLVVLVNLVMSSVVFPRLDGGFLAEPRWGATQLSAVSGLWSVLVALVVACLALVVLRKGRLRALASSLESGATASLLPLLNTASLVGFGAVVASLAGFEWVKDGVLGLYPENPLVSISLAVNLLAGITGSASGGMSIALQTLGETWLAMGQAAGIAPELLHRVTVVATGGLDALPHNGAVVTLLAICGLSHRESYLDIFVVAVVGPLLSLAVIVGLGSILGSF